MRDSKTMFFQPSLEILVKLQNILGSFFFKFYMLTLQQVILAYSKS